MISLSSRRTSLSVAGALALLAGAANAQQAPAAPAPVITVGSIAPDFELRGATRYGVLANPVRLSDYRGQTVVIAFFPKARTQGCTIQNKAYRDQYATLFNNGRHVTVIGISVDSDTALASWARDEQFPVLYASDSSGAIGRRYGARLEQYNLDARSVFVIGPDGRVTYAAQPFKELLPKSYAELHAAVQALAPKDTIKGS